MPRKIIEHRCMQVCRLRSYCIKHDYFTRGTNEEYEAMFNLIRGGRGWDVSLGTLFRVADAIYEHTDWSGCDDVQVTDVMAGLARDVCEYHYEEVTA